MLRYLFLKLTADVDHSSSDPFSLPKITDFDAPPHVPTLQLFSSSFKDTIDYNRTWNAFYETGAL